MRFQSVGQEVQHTASQTLPRPGRRQAAIQKNTAVRRLDRVCGPHLDHCPLIFEPEDETSPDPERE